MSAAEIWVSTDGAERIAARSLELMITEDVARVVDSSADEITLEWQSFAALKPITVTYTRRVLAD